MAGFDAIVIPGGGVHPGGELPPWVTPRFDRALERAESAYLMPLSAGTPHRAPPLNERGFPWTEARAGAGYLVRRGVDPQRILMEESSFDTIGNAYFSRVIHAIPREFTRLLIVTSEFHMPRTEALFRWVYALAGPGASCHVEFEAVADTEIDPDALTARLAKEQEALRVVELLNSKIRTLAQMHDWLFTAHKAYSWTEGSAGTQTEAPLY